MYILFTGDDVGGRFTRKFYLTLDTELDLTDCIVQFTLGKSVKSLSNVRAGQRVEIFFSRVETKALGVGIKTATLAIYDPDGRYRTIANDILVKCTDVVSEVYDGENNNLHYTLDYGLSWGSITDKPDLVTKEELENVQIKLTEVTYSQLKQLRDEGKLVAGSQYRITDYVATTSAANTESQNHQFDIIVIADSSYTLNEEARAAIHKGDTYFKGHRLESWKVWYALDNDSRRFNWASNNGKGVIYRLIDENNNDIPYDFKSITQNGWYTFQDHLDMSLDASVDSRECQNNIVPRGTSTGLLFNHFSYFCYNIKLGADCSGNFFGIDCHNITLGNFCRNNNFRGENGDITIGSFCTEIKTNNNSFEIIIGSGCSNILLGTCTNVNIGNGCRDIIVGEDENTLYSSHNLTIEEGVAVLRFAGLPSDKSIQNTKIESGVYSKVIQCTYDNKIYRDALTTIRPKGSYTLSV